MLDELELQILNTTLRAIADSSDPTDLELFQLLTADQKAQLWAVVPVELRRSIHQLKGRSA
ncbi:MAG: hypothetical protein KME11_12430 [Timaviella obliquedivisa GSE-PSE-MK23-08B]|nr:hypothetical protein [Timaviella obliquedivisa GSE-PSE-MK23-08B]